MIIMMMIVSRRMKRMIDMRQIGTYYLPRERIST